MLGIIIWVANVFCMLGVSRRCRYSFTSNPLDTNPVFVTSAASQNLVIKTMIFRQRANEKLRATATVRPDRTRKSSVRSLADESFVRRVSTWAADKLGAHDLTTKHISWHLPFLRRISSLARTSLVHSTCQPLWKATENKLILLVCWVVLAVQTSHLS